MSPLQVLLLVTVTIANGKVIEQSIFELGPNLYNFYASAEPKEVPDNFIASPLGLSIGLGLIQLGGSADLKNLILDEFFDWEGAEIDFHRNISQILKLLLTTYQHRDKRGGDLRSGTTAGQVKDLEDVELNIQCAIFHRDEVALQREFRMMALDLYHSQFIALDRRSNHSDQQQIIDNWARNSTHDLIKEFPAPKGFQVLLANTVYFEGDWVQPFAAEYTRTGLFHSTNNANHHYQVPYLQGQLEDIPYFESDLFKMVRLSYVMKNKNVQDIAMYVILPSKETTHINDVVNQLSFDYFRHTVKNRMVNETVNIKLPKLATNRKVNIKSVMDSLYLKEKQNRRWTREVKMNHTEVLVSPGEYYLSSASPDHNFILTDFIQESVLEVNEKGTRAASLSGGYINYDSLTKNFKCTRPYLMVIYDAQRDIVLFWSVIHKPVVN